jgi:hypothetical protein
MKHEGQNQMINKTFIKSVFVMGFLIGMQITGGAQSEGEFPEREELRRSFQLSPGATVEVNTIYGTVDIETADTDRAEVYIVRSARRREDFGSRPIKIEQTPTGLVVRGERDLSQEPAKVRHRVWLKLPRTVNLVVQKINAHVNIGEIEGTVRLARINGAANVAQASDYAELSSINGSLTITLNRIGARGITANDINGALEFRLPYDLDADVRVVGFNGSVNSEMPKTIVLQKRLREIFYARVGAGGAPISIKDVNGSVRFSPIGR